MANPIANPKDRTIMTLRPLIVAIALGLTSTVHAAGGAHKHAAGHTHQPLHGGVVAETRDVDLELVAGPAAIQLYVRGHGKPVDLSKASARLTLLSGTEKQEVELKPAGDRLEARGAFKVGPGTRAVAVVSIAGKATTARFAVK